VTKEENVRLSGQNGSAVLGNVIGDVTDILSIPLSAKLRSTLLKEQERKQRDLLKEEADAFQRGMAPPIVSQNDNYLTVDSKGR